MMSNNFSSKVLIDCFHYGQSRGISIYTNNLIDNINSNPHLKNIKFYLLVNKKLSIDVTSKNIKVIKLPKLNIIVWEQLIVPLIAILYRADKVHYLGNTFSPLIKSLIVSIHDVSYLKKDINISGPISFKQYVGKFYRQILLKYFHFLIKKVITVSDFAKNDIVKELGYSAKKVNVVPNIVSQNYLEPINWKKKQNIILIVTGNTKQKNIDLTLQYLQKIDLNEFKVDVIGIKKNNYKNFCFHNSISHYEMKDFYNKSKILLIPSLYESFSIPSIEASARGCLIVSSKHGAISQTIDNEGFFYEPQKFESLKKILEESKTFLEEKKAKEILTYRAKKVERYSQQSLFEDISRIYL